MKSNCWSRPGLGKQSSARLLHDIILQAQLHTAAASILLHFHRIVGSWLLPAFFLPFDISYLPPVYLPRLNMSATLVSTTCQAAGLSAVSNFLAQIIKAYRAEVCHAHG